MAYVIRNKKQLAGKKTKQTKFFLLIMEFVPFQNHLGWTPVRLGGLSLDLLFVNKTEARVVLTDDRIVLPKKIKVAW